MSLTPGTRLGRYDVVAALPSTALRAGRPLDTGLEWSMSLAPGTRLGRYDVVAALPSTSLRAGGAGGMGEVLFHQGKTDEALGIVRRIAAVEAPSRCKQHSRGVLFRCLSYVAPDAARTYLRETEIPLPTDGAVNAYGHGFNLMNVVEGLYVLGDRDAVATLMPLTEMFAASEITVLYTAASPRAAAGVAAASAGSWDAAEKHFREGLALCDSIPVVLHRGTTREWYGDMLMMRNAGDDRARAATLYAEAAENYDTIGLVLYASRLAEKRARLPFV